LNFIVGDEVIPLDAEKHTETPLMEGIDPACVFLQCLGNTVKFYTKFT